MRIIDVPPDGDESLFHNANRMQVYRLTAIDPEPLVETLNQVGNLDPQTQLKVDKKNRSIIAYAPLVDHVTIKTLVDKLDGTDRRFEVIHTPGHSPGGIALWEAATGILFSGDIVYDGELIEGTSDLERWQYIVSMERLLRLPVRVVHGGHFPSYSGARHREIIESWLRAKGR